MLVAGEMHLDDAFAGKGVQIGDRVGAGVEAGDEDIVDVEKQSAAGLLGETAQKFRLVHGRLGEADVAARILEDQWPPEKVLNLADPAGDMGQALLGQRHRQKIVRIEAEHAGPAQMVADPGRLHLGRERLEPGEIIHVERIGASDRQRDAVKHDRIMLGDLADDGARAAARIHEILGDRLEPVDRRTLGEDMVEMDASEAETEAEARQAGYRMFRQIGPSPSRLSSPRGSPRLRTRRAGSSPGRARRAPPPKRDGDSSAAAAGAAEAARAAGGHVVARLIVVADPQIGRAGRGEQGGRAGRASREAADRRAISPSACFAISSSRRPGQTFSSNTARARSQTLLPWFGPLVLNRSALIGVAQEPSERQSFMAGTSSSSAVPYRPQPPWFRQSFWTWQV